MLKKHLRVELPAEVGWDEQLFPKDVEDNPEFSEALIKAELRSRGAEFPGELNAIEEQIKKYEQLERLRETLEPGRKPPRLTLRLRGWIVFPVETGQGALDAIDKRPGGLLEGRLTRCV